MPPNGSLRASPGRELRGGVDPGFGLAPGIGKGTEMSGYPGRVGPDFLTFSRLFPEWFGKVLGVLFGGLGEQQIKNLPGAGPEGLIPTRHLPLLHPGSRLWPSTTHAFLTCPTALPYFILHEIRFGEHVRAGTVEAELMLMFPGPSPMGRAWAL